MTGHHDAAVAQRDVALAERDAARRDLEAARLTHLRAEQSVTWQAFERTRRGVIRALGGERSPLLRLLQAVLRAFGRRALRR
jgi:hypothetical protein